MKDKELKEELKNIKSRLYSIEREIRKDAVVDLLSARIVAEQCADEMLYKFNNGVEALHNQLRSNGYYGKQWIELDIDNLPERFFTRDDIEIETDCRCTTWEPTFYNKENRCEIIRTYIKCDDIKYRYRIIEKEPMRVDRWTYELLMKQIVSKYQEDWNHKDLVLGLGREVIIID